MVNENQVIVEKHCHDQNHHLCVKRVCWSAIFAGVLVGLGLGFLLHLYGVALSLSVYSSSSDGASVIAIGGLLAMIVGIIASMGIAGFVAGHLGRFHYHGVHGGVLYGFITWSLILVLTAVIAGPMGYYFSSYSKSLSHPVGLQAASVVVSDSNGTVTTTKTKKTTTVQSNSVTPTELAWGGWILFGLFFIGAFSSCVGACCGMRRCRE
ncbi:MAG: hypothetical protein EPN84_05880 [Legionella sp.]|nr:MAG: hypothetical protein EPN84_05880 [Legionella sp.]